MSSIVDWGLVKFHYENLGMTVEQLSEEFGLGKTMIEYAIDQQKWEQLPICAAMQDLRVVDDLQDIGEELVTEVQERMRIAQTIKQSTLGPKYIAFEAAMISKATEILRAVRPESPNAPQQIKMLTDVLIQLREQNGMSQRQTDSGKQAGGVTVKIMSQVSPDGEAKTAAQVSIASEV